MLARVPVRALLVGALFWLIGTLVTAAVIGCFNYVRLRDNFETEARTLHRILSQRADQHDAHLTSLAAIVSSPDRSISTLRAVSEAVLRFYPRITAIDVLVVEPEPEVTFTTRELGPGPRSVSEIVDLARGLSPGQAAVRSGEGEAYDLIKRLPAGNSHASALAMTVEGKRLIELEGGPLNEIRLALHHPSGREIIRVGDPVASNGTAPVFTFEKALGSRSQPLLLTLARHLPLREILPPVALALSAMGAALCVLLGAFTLRERRTARDARERASFHAHEARLAHAMRVNTVGEMASGIAHELTQPLTAILSCSQAGLHLARSQVADRGEILAVLEANIRAAKRAGDILARLRAYVSNKGPAPEPTALNQAVRNVVELVEANLHRRGVTLALALSPDDPISLVDRVSIEQVVHNLVRNAADAVEVLPPDRRGVKVATVSENSEAVITVSDRGPGILAENVPRLFEPFFTTKPNGMGLGLPLCERLVESFGGQITAANQPHGGAVFTIRLPRLVPGHREAVE
jgi:two-component system, LuxR family, sensor kinase FixL